MIGPELWLTCITWASTASLQRLTNRSGPRRIALLQLLHHFRKSCIHAVLSLWHPVHQGISTAERDTFPLQKQTSLSSVCYIASFSLTLFLFHSFLWSEAHITGRAAQEGLFRLVTAQKTQREKRESEKRSFSDWGRLSEEPSRQIKKPVGLV